jgi:hypothetical protein
MLLFTHQSPYQILIIAQEKEKVKFEGEIVGEGYIHILKAYAYQKVASEVCCYHLTLIV